MKRISALILILTLVCTLMSMSMAAESADTAWKTIYVSPAGDDSADGSSTAPFRTFTRAQEEVRKYNKDMQGDIVVSLAGGRYEISDFIEFKMEDSGYNGHNVIWRGQDDSNLPILSGGVEITGNWTKGDDGIWHVKADNLEFARDLFVNGRIATRARSPKMITGKAQYNEPGVKYTDPQTGEEREFIRGFYVDKSMLGLYENPEDVEFGFKDTFRASNFHVDDIIQDPDNENQVIALMDREVWDIYRRTGAVANYNRYFFVQNAYELLDEPGEFYFNKKTKILSYIPREGEDMSNAEVICPQLDRLMYVHGENYYNRLKNLKFENIQFSHTADLFFEYCSVFGGQAEYHYSTYRPGPTTFSSNTVDWAENIAFEGCVFYGLGPVALHYRDGVFDSVVQGNVFADTGASQFMAGIADHRYFEELIEKDGPLDVAWRSPFTASYQHIGSGHTTLNTSRMYEHSMEPGSGWYSEPWATEEGTLPWVKIRMETYYTLESFQFSFPKNATEEQRNNFEVLVSADKDFEQYKKIAEYTTPADFNETINIGDGEKYRYIMLRKTKPGPFCLNGVWAWSNDRLEQGIMGAPKNCTIANNYFTRPGLAKTATYPIMVNYTENFKIVHNEIVDCPYSAVSVGWGWEWAKATTSKNNYISYNRMDRIMSTSSDGAGVYIFGEQPGSLIERNFVSNATYHCFAVYFDMGCTGTLATDNVSLHNGTDALIKSGYGEKNILRNMYTADSGKYDIYGEEGTYIADPAIHFSYNNPPEEVVRIMAESGIEDEWLWIKERVPEEEANRINLLGPDAARIIKSQTGMQSAVPRREEVVLMANNMLKSGTFGSLPWEFSPESERELKYWLKAMTDSSSRADDMSVGHLEEQIALDDAIERANESVYHPTYDEMVDMCKKLESDATSQNYPQEAINKFKTDFASVCANTYEGRGDKAIAASKLEEIYTDLVYQSYKTEITDIIVDDGYSVIDAQNKKATIYVPISIDYAVLSPVICTNPGTEVADVLEDLDFSQGKVSVPLYNASAKKYDFWTMELKPKSEMNKGTRVTTDSKDWTDGNINVPVGKVGDSVTIDPWFQPTMNKKLMDGKVEFSLNAPRADTMDGISVIFSSQTENLLATTYADRNSYYMLTLKGKAATLYKVVGGKSTPCATVKDAKFKYNEYNNFEITVNEENSYDRIKIKLNNKTIIDVLEDTPIGKTGHFGIMTKNMAVKLK